MPAAAAGEVVVVVPGGLDRLMMVVGVLEAVLRAGIGIAV